MSESWPVTMQVTRADGSVEHVRVGTAVKSGEGFRLTLDSMTINPPGAAASRPSTSSRGAVSRAPAGADSGMVFPNYGRSKGMPISGASLQDLEFYANGSRRSLSDPSKERFHAKERQLLAAIEAEIARQRGGGGDDDGPPPPGDADAPPPGHGDDDAPF